MLTSPIHMVAPFRIILMMITHTNDDITHISCVIIHNTDGITHIHDESSLTLMMTSLIPRHQHCSDESYISFTSMT